MEGAARSSGRARSDIALVVVTKTYPASDVAMLRDLGVTDFGENRDAEGQEKSSLVSARWHFQGQIQSNKIASIAKWADVIHSLDNSKHIAKFEKSVPAGKILSIFLQVSLDGPLTNVHRGGVPTDELFRLAEMTMGAPQLRLMGIMAVAPLNESPYSAFSRLAEIHSIFRDKFPSASALSAGMSGDFEEAIAHGATHIRVGSSILGVRTSQR
jgi:pyridoxal phosphate enzyme (YggS family)